MGPIRLALLGELPEALLTELRRVMPEVEVADDTAELDVVVAWDPDVEGLRRTLQRHPRLQWVHARWAGIPDAVLAMLADHAAVLTNGSGAHGVAIAEFVVGVIMAHFRQLYALRAAQQRAEWVRPTKLRELRGSTIGIVGLGDLGGSIAQALRAFGVHLRGLRRSPQPSADVDEVFNMERLAPFLDGLDVLIVAAPLTRHTRGLIGTEQLARLKPGALLVNVGRGAIVDESAMIAALDSGALGGAALDVFSTEPLPAESPLWKHENVFISPHCADAVPPSTQRAFELLVDNLRRFRAGQPLRNVVDRDEGY